ncbi:MAG: tRNA pseudouridine(38-40) synthase TruA [Oscillospiraceae bacterium]
MNILLRLSFNGSRYHGFQVQANALSICTVLQNAMEKLFGARPDVKGCSRTDAGVHALEYCVSFHCEAPISNFKLPLALNHYLPPDIRVTAAQRVAEDFHARYSALGKEYHYVFLNAAVDNPFTPGLYHRVPGALDAEAMLAAGQALGGYHNFDSFMSAGSDIQDTARTVTALSVRREGERVVLRVAADGFLYNMVRIMAGTLLKVGTGRCGAAYVGQALQARHRGQAGETMPAKGLFLARVYYPPEPLPTSL